MTQANPIYKQDQEELARLDDSVASLSQGLRKKASQQLEAKWELEEARTGSIEARLQAQLAQQTAVATGATPKLQRAPIWQLTLRDSRPALQNQTMRFTAWICSKAQQELCTCPWRQPNPTRQKRASGK